MKDKISKKIMIVLIITSVYYLPYLLLGWAGVAGVKEGSAPTWYKIFRIILPFIFIVILNIKFKIKLNIISYISFILLNVNIISNIIYKNNIFSYEIFIYFLFYILCPNFEFKFFKKSYLLLIFLFSFISVIFEKYFLLKIFGIHPVFVMSWQERYIGNMAGPNTLGAFINLVWVLLLFRSNKKNKILKLGITLIAFYLIKATDSDGAIIIFLLSLWYMFLKLIKNLKRIYLILTSFCGIGIVHLKFESFIRDGSNIARLKSIFFNLKEIEILSLKFIFNENTFFMILFSYGILVFIIYLLFWILIWLYDVFKYKSDTKFYLMKQIIFFQILIYSLVLPIKFIFPMNILYILSLKLKEGEKYEE